MNMYHVAFSYIIKKLLEFWSFHTFMLSVLSAKHPIDCAAMMAGGFPEGFAIPEGVKQPQTAWLYESNTALEKYLHEVNSPSFQTTEENVHVTINRLNPNIRHFVGTAGLTAQEVRKAWDRMFSETRRWRNDTFGTYQERTNFSEEGFISHVNDTSLGTNNGFPQTWYEYIPPQLRGSGEKVPLLFYFHGGGCIPLYGAEQSNWHRIARKEGFIVVYPKASIEKRWNAWDDPSVPSDFEYVLALIEHINEIHPIDRSRIYISGFSMGSMMTNALACAYPDVFAAGAPCNAQHLGYFTSMQSLLSRMPGGAPSAAEESDEHTHTRVLADAKKHRRIIVSP